MQYCVILQLLQWSAHLTVVARGPGNEPLFHFH